MVTFPWTCLLLPSSGQGETSPVSTVREIEEVARPPRSLWDRILAEPDRAPEHIALAAAERFGPGAAEWARTAGRDRTG